VGIDDGQEEEEPALPWLPPEDRLWRHPSEVGSDGPSPTQPLSRSFPSGGQVWTVAMAAGLVGALVASALFMATGNLHIRTKTVVEPIATPTSVLTNATKQVSPAANDASWAGIASNIDPSVVAVSSAVGGTGTTNGSGVIYAVSNNVTDIITASDLLMQGGTVTVTFANQTSQTAKEVGSDPITGIAVVSVTAKGRNDEPSYGSVSSVAVAEQVMPLGARQPDGADVVQATIGGLDESVVNSENDSDTMYGMLAITGGPVSSETNGGPVVDSGGAIVGIDSDVSNAQQQDVNYAVPIDIVRHVATQLIAHIPVTHPWVGIEDAADLSTLAATQLDVKGGAQVGAVAPGSPAAGAGLQTNDIVTSLNGQAVGSSGWLIEILASLQPDQRVQLEYLHDGLPLTRMITIKNQPVAAAAGS
jgi:putative serine protease PepD